MSSPENSDTVRKRKRVLLQESTVSTEGTFAYAKVMQKLDLLVERNRYLEREYAFMAKQLKEEKQNLAARGAAIQQVNELEAKCASLQTKNASITQRMNEYHKQMQQAQSEVISFKRKLNGILGHIRAALSRDSRPGSRDAAPTSPYEMIQLENKLLKWKLSVVDGCLNGMFSEEELKQ